MKKPDTPHDEALRLDTLRSLNILDTDAEERFDRLTRMAQRIFDVPIALVSLVDSDRQWFKSCIGLDAVETPRSISFCGHAILDDNVFMITDATRDPRFADNPLVTGEPHVRFYAGCPLRALNGQKVGTLCIIDRQPRTLDADAVALLEDLAAMVERELSAVQLATLDELTGVANRRGFVLLADYSLRLCAREDLPAAVVVFDLDGFKSINDAYGHAEGDQALRAFAARLVESHRESDLVARLGGDEFAVLLAPSTAEQAQAVLQRLREAIDDYNREASRDYLVRFSHGIAAYDPLNHETIADLLREADRRMYADKSARSGRPGPGGA